MTKVFAVLLACSALLVAGCGSDKKTDTNAKAKPTATIGNASSGQPAATPDKTPKGCQSVGQPDGKATGAIKKPTEKLSASKTYIATVSTTCGTFQITLDSKRAPKTGGSFKYLADQHFFDGTTFHRIVPNFVIQGGDPLGTGSGGPGYTVVEAPPKDLKYTIGTVAMAKTDSEPAGASGSQFFVVTGDGNPDLPPDYALLGKVTSGMDVASRIGGIASDQQTGLPVAAVVIKSITVAEQ